ncbi:MAG: D-alanine--D-alanine ligase [Pyrinomonadaceae bacterium]|nr:D-alanine--D-alanine ligase [Pyrinomonadaceae bacterium]
MRKTIGVIFGGRSGEHEISVRSANTVIRDMDRSKYRVIPIAIGQDGTWLEPATSLGLLSPECVALVEPDITSIDPRDIIFISNPKVRDLRDDKIGSPIEIDVLFPVLHGTNGEDGTIQGLMEIEGAAYVGCGVLASSCGMDKVVMKSLFKEAGLPICKHVSFLRSEWEHDPDIVRRSVNDSIGFPCFVKPANLGSSVGISRAENDEELTTAINVAAMYDRRIIAEEALKMREIECAIIGNDHPQASLPGEYIIRDRSKVFLDYTEKYAGTGNNEFVVPAPVSEQLSDRIRQMAIAAFKAIDGSGLARVDFFLRTDNGALLVNEINTMPGLTDASGFPKMWAASGKSMSLVIDELIDLAIERNQDKQRNMTSLV